MSKVMTAQEAVDMVKDGMSFAISGFGTFGLPEDLLCLSLIHISEPTRPY